MGGLLGVLLETTAAAQQEHLPPHTAPAAAAAATPAQIIVSKATTAKNGHDSDGSSRAPVSSSVPAPAASASTSCSFLRRCFLCRSELADGRDIYIYRGDRAFCSEECRCRHILAEGDDDCARVVVADLFRRRQVVAGGFAVLSDKVTGR